MNQNPYAAPEHSGKAPLSDERKSSLTSIRIALGIMLFPTLYNFVCFNGPLFTQRDRMPLNYLFMATNLVGLIVVLLAVWFIGLWFFERVSDAGRVVFGRSVTKSDWNEPLYSMLQKLKFFAIPGAVIWCIWNFCFYTLEINFYTISIPIGVAAHILAAILYTPVLIRWYQLRNSKGNAAANIAKSTKQF